MRNKQHMKKIRVTQRSYIFLQDGGAVHTSTVRMFLSRGSREDVALTASSSFSCSLAHTEKDADSLLKRSHHVRIISSWTVLGDDTENLYTGNNPSVMSKRAQIVGSDLVSNHTQSQAFISPCASFQTYGLLTGNEMSAFAGNCET